MDLHVKAPVSHEQRQRQQTGAGNISGNPCHLDRGPVEQESMARNSPGNTQNPCCVWCSVRLVPRNRLALAFTLGLSPDPLLCGERSAPEVLLEKGAKPVTSENKFSGPP